jgi:hypothetical protein
MYKSFYEFKKNQILIQNPKLLASVLPKTTGLLQNLTETPHFLAVKPIF